MIEKKVYRYLLPIGLAPKKVVECKEELEAALGGVCEFDFKGRYITITCYKGELPKVIPYQIPEQNPKGLTIPIGYNMAGDLITIDQASDSSCYILAGGYQGTGKSNLANGMCYAITRYPPEWVRLVLIDLKRGVELKQWASYPHKWLTAFRPDMPELKHCLTMLKAEIDKRYTMFEQAGVRDINFYRKKVGPMNYIYLVVDEFAELTNSDDGEKMQTLLKRILQVGRAAGLRCSIFLQRPTVTNVSGDIKALFPTRIALRCATKLESRVILDTDGAELLEDETPGRALILHKARYEKIQIMKYLSPDTCVLPTAEHNDAIE